VLRLVQSVVAGREGRSPPRIVRFGIFELDLRSVELRRDGVRVAVPGQSLQALALLLEQPGELVTREALRQRLWPAGTYVDFEHGLNAVIKRLRDALGDSAGAPRFIETLARRGYRFIAPVERLGKGSASAIGRGAEWCSTPVALLVAALAAVFAIRLFRSR
jgi:DNA-binding winged helix-turn-helix (wHTH) protein